MGRECLRNTSLPTGNPASIMVRVLPTRVDDIVGGIRSCGPQMMGEESARDCSSGEQCRDYRGEDGHCDDSWNRTFSPRKPDCNIWRC